LKLGSGEKKVDCRKKKKVKNKIEKVVSANVSFNNGKRMKRLKSAAFRIMSPFKNIGIMELGC
jgi:hypothetical protein